MRSHLSNNYFSQCTIMLLHMFSISGCFVAGVTENVAQVDTLEMMSDSFSQLMLTIISCIGIPGNIIVLIVILAAPEMRSKVFNMFIVHQSVIDLLACVGTLLRQFFYDTSFVKVGKGRRKKNNHAIIIDCF